MHRVGESCFRDKGILVERTEEHDLPGGWRSDRRRRRGCRWGWLGSGLLIMGLAGWGAWLRAAEELSPSLAAAPCDAPRGQAYPRAWADELGKPREYVNRIGLELRLIPPGEFRMGSPESEAGRLGNEGPRHQVRLTRPFYLGRYPVTVGQFRAFVQATGYRTDAERGLGYAGAFGIDLETGKYRSCESFSWRNTGFPQAEDHPVVNVSWNDAVAFCRWLSQREGREYRLVSEAEWEYACRAGTTTRFFHGDDAEGLATVGNVADAALQEVFPGWPGAIAACDGQAFTAPVGSYQANAFGLFDMHGNVREWCQDVYGANTYQRGPVEDPSGPAGGSNRVIRGGGWSSRPAHARAAYRDGIAPGSRYDFLGFRIARSLADPPPETQTDPAPSTR